MWSEDKIEEYLKSNLKESRFIHSLGVKNTAVKLAKKYNADEDKARIAGLIHDCAKGLKAKELVSLLEKEGIILSEVELNNPQIKHGLAGAIISEKIFNVTDKEVLNAVTYHTTGKKDMTVLEKIIYLADYVEPSRSFPGVEVLREEAFNDLDNALLMAFNSTIKFVIEKGQLLHIDTISARNYLIINNSFRGDLNEKRDS